MKIKNSVKIISHDNVSMNSFEIVTIKEDFHTENMYWS
jgi:hypothetical protein